MLVLVPVWAPGRNALLIHLLISVLHNLHCLLSFPTYFLFLHLFFFIYVLPYLF